MISKQDAAAAVRSQKTELGLTWAQLAEAVGRPVAWTTAALLGQHPRGEAEAPAAAELLELDREVALALRVQPTRGALDAQVGLGFGAIGGKDSMSGSFEDIHVPPTLVSFAVSTAHVDDIVSPEFKKPGSVVALLCPAYDGSGLPEAGSVRKLCATVTDLLRSGRALSAWALGQGGVAEAAMKMAFGNGVGLTFEESLTLDDIFSARTGSFLLEMASDLPEGGLRVGVTAAEPSIAYKGEACALSDLENIWEGRLEPVFPSRVAEDSAPVTAFTCHMPAVSRKGQPFGAPRVLIPVFPGTNCEYDSARAFERAGVIPAVQVINNMTPQGVQASVERFSKALSEAQILFLPGGFSGGDEPDGSGKFITAFLRNPLLTDGVMGLLDRREGLVGGICNGFQALVKLGLVPYGRILPMDSDSPTLTYNVIGRHQSRLVRARVCSSLSPWLQDESVGDIDLIPISHGEGRFVAPAALIEQMAKAGQIATQYVDENGVPSMDIDVNPNGSYQAIEGVTSPDGRVFGRMAHAERTGAGLYKNVSGRDGLLMFTSAVRYFK